MKHNGAGFEDARILIGGLKWMFDSMQLPAPLKDRGDGGAEGFEDLGRPRL